MSETRRPHRLTNQITDKNVPQIFEQLYIVKFNFFHELRAFVLEKDMFSLSKQQIDFEMVPLMSPGGATGQPIWKCGSLVIGHSPRFM